MRRTHFLSSAHIALTDLATWSAQDLVDTPFRPPDSCGLEGVGTHPAQMAMATKWIVERFDVVGNVRQRDLSGPVNLLLDLLLLQTAKEGFGDGVVPAVPLAAHAGLQVIPLAESAPVITPILSPLVGVDNGFTRSPASHRHQDRVKRKLPSQGRSG